jgi:hypothetical protein
MPEFTTVSMTEATLQTSSGRQKRYLAEYIDYIKTLPKGQAERLTIGEQEKHTSVRRQLVTTAKAMNIPLIVKRSGNDLYFWRENGGEEQPRPRRGRRPRRQAETTIPETPEQYFKEEGELEQGVPKEDSPELGQTPV